MISAKDKFKAYGIGFLSVIITALLGMFFMKDNINSEWYKSLRTTIIPPSYVFPIVWTILYVLLAIVIGRTILFKKYILLILLIISLMLHISWSYLYFYKKDPKSAFINIIIILFIGFIISSGTKDVNIVQLLVPYISWITFAAVINYDTMKKLE